MSDCKPKDFDAAKELRKTLISAIIDESVIKVNKYLYAIFDDRVVININWYSSVATVGIITAVTLTGEANIYIGVVSGDGNIERDVKYILDYGYKTPINRFIKEFGIPLINQ